MSNTKKPKNEEIITLLLSQKHKGNVKKIKKDIIESVLIEV